MTKQNKIKHAWAFYDWANSVYSLVVTTAVFPIFYGALFTQRGVSEIDFMGFQVKNTALISFASAFGFLIISFISPLLSGVADVFGYKRLFMKIFCYTGALACVGLYWFSLDNVYWGLLFYVVALVGFWGSLVFYNSFLPDIAPPEEQNSLSAKGYALGYVGSVILLVICLALIMSPQTFFIHAESDGLAAMKAMKISFVAVGLWWIGFSQYTYAYLPKGAPKVSTKTKGHLFRGFQELKTVYASLKGQKMLKGFLLSFFIYSMGLQTVMLVAVYFGEQEIAWEDDAQQKLGLIVSILLIQLIAIPGAFMAAKISNKIGNIKTLMALNLLWMFICFYAFYISAPFEFYVTGACVGLVMGGIQSLSRSTYSKLLDGQSDTASFFSFYDVSEKIGIVIGMVLYGSLHQITGSARVSVLFLGVFFFAGFFLLKKLNNYEKKTHHYL